MEIIELKNLPKDYVSVSQIEMFRRCPQQFYFRYVKGLKIPPPFAIVVGSSVHETLHTNFKIKSETNQDMLQDEFIDCFDYNLTKNIQEAKITYGEINLENENPDKTKDEIIDTLKVYHADELPKLFPEKSELEFTLTLSTGLKIYGKIDYIDRQKIIEYKTAKNKQKIQSPPNQLSIYNLVSSNKNLRLDRLLRKGNYEIFNFITSSERAKEILIEYNNISKFIRTGITYRNPGFNDINCNLCGYKDICRKIL